MPTDARAVAPPDAASASATLFSPYKDTGTALDWNTNVVSTEVSGKRVALATDLAAHGASAVTLAFATGECGAETWASVDGAAIAAANEPLLAGHVRYVVATGGAGGIFTCATDSGMEAFVARWMSPDLVGVDFDIEAGQTSAQITDLVRRVAAAHAAHPALRFSFTVPTLAPSRAGQATAVSLGAAAADGLDSVGDQVMTAIANILGFSGTAASWPDYVTIDLMTMDYGSADASNCVVSGSSCEMGQSAIQAAYDLHDRRAVPYGAIELTPMIGQNDTAGESVTLADVDAIAAFAIARGLAGVHYWSYDRDTDCAAGAASSTCSSMGVGYAGAYGYLARFLAAGLR